MGADRKRIDQQQLLDHSISDSSQSNQEKVTSRYGDLMAPLNINDLFHLLSPNKVTDAEVIRFLHLCDATSRAEKISDPSAWSVEEREVYDRGDWQTFSRLRGYTDQEISEFAEFIALSKALNLKYGPDYAISLSHMVDVHTRKLPGP